MDMKGLQAKLAGMQKKMDEIKAETNVGGEEGVTVKMNGKFNILDLKVNFLPKEKEDLEILEDMLKKAFSENYAKIENEIKKHTGGMF